jgi:hypothetical protein
MKRRSVQQRKRRGRCALSPYARKDKKPFHYPFPTGPGAWELRQKAETKRRGES